MKKILLITRPISPPWDEASKNFAYFIAKNIQDVEMNLMSKVGETLPKLPQNAVQHGIYTTSEIAEFNLQQKLRSIYFQFISRGKYDINHYFFTPTWLNSFLIKNFLTKKSSKTIQTVATLREDIWTNEDLKNLLFADLIITYSDYAKNKLNELGYENVRRIYPGIDLEKYKPQPKDITTLEHFGIKNDETVIIYPGEYVRLGATDNIVNSLPELFKQIPNAKFIFANRVKNEADAKKKEEVVFKLKEFNIFEKVTFTDTFSDMPKIYNIADIVIFPVADMKGKFDVPLAVIEAMACEKPVIISDLPILKEFASSDNSVIIETGNNEQMICEIVRLSNNKEVCQKIGQAARIFAQENFDINQVAQKYEEIYKNF
ncbi:MAG: glycosyl transferase group 1 [uncultured bacterium]|nr:MAG: glycosyl transferase group 1 [uncultured bacterium]